MNFEKTVDYQSGPNLIILAADYITPIFKAEHKTSILLQKVF
jgi:hypothetical protein